METEARNSLEERLAGLIMPSPPRRAGRVKSSYTVPLGGALSVQAGGRLVLMHDIFHRLYQRILDWGSPGEEHEFVDKAMDKDSISGMWLGSRYFCQLEQFFLPFGDFHPHKLSVVFLGAQGCT